MSSSFFRVLKIVGGALSALLILAFAGFWHIYVNTVTIANNSSVPLENVQIDLGETVLFTGVLLPGQVRQFHGVPRTEGSLAMFYEVSGQPLHRRFDYVTPGLSGHHVITIISQSNIRYD